MIVFYYDSWLIFEDWRFKCGNGVWYVGEFVVEVEVNDIIDVGNCVFVIFFEILMN